MRRSTKKTNAEALQDIVKDYNAAGQPWPADKRTIATWAVGMNRYSAQRKTLIDQCAQDLAKAMRLEMESDPQGRSVRAKYCAKIAQMDKNGVVTQRTLWFDRSAPPELMHPGLQQRRNAILGDCKQLKTDQDSYNANNPHGATIQLSFNFELDLADLEHDTEYNPQPPSDEEED